MSNTNLLLDSNQFYSGSPMRGKAICYFRSDKEIKKIRIKLTGEESTSWTVYESYYDYEQDRRTYRTVCYHGRHDFIVCETIIHGEGILSAGQHEFPFELLLPENMPGTFEHQNGRIKFWLTLTVDRPWKTDFESLKEIIIISPLRLPSNFLQPVEISDEKMVGCFCCISGPIQLDARLAKRAFAVGEHAGIEVRCINMSDNNVNSLVAEIKLLLTFKATQPSYDYRYDSELVAISHNSGVGAHGEKTLNLRLHIPPSAVVPNFTGCQLFSSETRVKVSAGLSEIYKDLSVSTDVALGHVSCSQVSPITTPPERSLPMPVPAPMTMPMSTAMPTAMPAVMPMPMPHLGYEGAANKTIGFCHGHVHCSQGYSITTQPECFSGYPPVPVPAPMPMPHPGYEAVADRTIGFRPYPAPGSFPGPSGLQEFGTPSAPPKSILAKDNVNSDAGNSILHEPPPPSYEEAVAKNYK